MKNRNRAIDFLKFIFAIIIVVFHGTESIDPEGGIFRSGRLAVEFFFIVSGYFMCVSAEKFRNQEIGFSTFSFIKNKVLKLMPNYYVGWVIAFLFTHIFRKIEFKTALIDIVKSVPELLMIGHAGFLWYRYNGVTWYLSAMLLSMAIVFPLILKYKERFYYIIAPISFLFITGFLFKTKGSLSAPFEWVGFCYLGLPRGFAEIMGGCICYKISRYLKRIRFKPLMRTIISFMEWGLYSAAIIYMFAHKVSRYDFVVLFILMAAVTITLSNVSLDKNIFRSEVFQWLGEYSFSLYLGHTYWRILQSYIFPAAWDLKQRMTGYFVLSLITGLFIMYVSKGLKVLWRRISPQVKKCLLEE